jgi:hypothetical protein
MVEVFTANPWLIVILLGVLIPLCGIVFGTVTKYLQNVRQAELDASLKQEMLQRGMSADDIVRVIEARSRGGKSSKCQNSAADAVQGVGN